MLCFQNIHFMNIILIWNGTTQDKIIEVIYMNNGEYNINVTIEWK